MTEPSGKTSSTRTHRYIKCWKNFQEQPFKKMGYMWIHRRFWSCVFSGAEEIKMTKLKHSFYVLMDQVKHRKICRLLTKIGIVSLNFSLRFPMTSHTMSAKLIRHLRMMTWKRRREWLSCVQSTMKRPRRASFSQSTDSKVFFQKTTSSNKSSKKRTSGSFRAIKLEQDWRTLEMSNCSQN